MQQTSNKLSACFQISIFLDTFLFNLPKFPQR